MRREETHAERLLRLVTVPPVLTRTLDPVMLGREAIALLRKKPDDFWSDDAMNWERQRRSLILRADGHGSERAFSEKSSTDIPTNGGPPIAGGGGK